MYKSQLPLSAYEFSKIYKNEKIIHFKDNPIKCLGFVVNVKDSINFDIDFELTTEDKKKLLGAKTRHYMYDEYIDFDAYHEKKVGESFRCRIHDVRINKKELSIIKKLKVFNKIKLQLDECDGWVVCKIYGIDEFKRLLVDLFFPIKKDSEYEFLNIKDFLTNEKKQIFQIKY